MFTKSELIYLLEAIQCFDRECSSAHHSSDREDAVSKIIEKLKKEHNVEVKCKNVANCTEYQIPNKDDTYNDVSLYQQMRERAKESGYSDVISLRDFLLEMQDYSNNLYYDAAVYKPIDYYTKAAMDEVAERCMMYARSRTEDRYVLDLLDFSYTVDNYGNMRINTIRPGLILEESLLDNYQVVIL